MFNTKTKIFIAALFLTVAGVWFGLSKNAEAAQSQFVPTSGNLVTGAEKNSDSSTAAAATGVNMGSWRGTLADDNFHWSITGSTGNPSGFDTQLNLDNVTLNGANKMLIQTEIDTDAALAVKFQICDWVSSTSVDSAADAQCTTGGWRTLNTQSTINTDINYTANASVALQWHIYDGYFTTGTTGGTAISTPLSNFVKADSTKRVKFRYLSATSSLTDLDIDFLRITNIVDSVYYASGLTNQGSGTATGTYASTVPIGNTASAQMTATTGDAVYVTVAGTAGTVGDFYLSFKNIKTLVGMNSILVRADYSCSAATGNLTPQIRNFTTSSWENLSAATIACSATDALNGWAKSNINIADYLSSGEARVRWVASANGTHTMRIDSIYLMVGSVNDNTSLCEVTIGSGTATNCSNTRTLDMNSTTSSFDNTAEDLSTNMGTGEAAAQYATDAVQTASTEATASNISVPLILSDNTQITGINYAYRFAAGTNGTPALTVRPGIRDYSGLYQTTGGWTAVGTTSANATQVYTDTITTLAINTYGMTSNAREYVDSIKGLMNTRLYTSTNGNSATNAVTAWDFAFMSAQWVEDSNRPSTNYHFEASSQNLVNGTELAVDATTAASATTGINMGSWKGTLADDNLHWAFASKASGYDAQLNIDNVRLNNANKILINTEIDLNANVPATKIQICDWVSSTSVDDLADAQCTGGGWRTLNTQDASNADVNYTGTSTAALQWHIYDGYWSTGTTGGTAVSTPLTNFVTTDSLHRVKIRYYSTTNTTSTVGIDWLRISPIIDSVYDPASITQITGGTMVGSYVNAQALGNTASAQVAGSNDIRIGVPGTAGAISDFYFTFNNVRTYTGANTIYVKAEYSCSTTGINHRPKIYNFNSSAWENLGSAAIACSATDATNAFAKNNVTVSNYINGSNQIRVGWFGSANNTLQIRIDHIFVMLGTTNSDNTQCQITLGTGTATACDQTRTVDETTVPGSVDWDITAEDVSTTMGTGEANSIYGADHAPAASTENVAANVTFSVTKPSAAMTTGIHFASRIYPGVNSTNPDLILQLQAKDESGQNQTTGGWSNIGAATSTGTTIISDSISAVSTTAYGILSNPEDYLNNNQNTVNYRIRTSTAGTSSVNAVTSWDYVMTSMSWVEPLNNSQLITVSGTCQAYDQSTSCGDTGEVKLALNGYLTGPSQPTVAGTWSISNVRVYTGDVVTAFIDGAADADEAAAVTKYDGSGNIDNFVLYKQNVTIGTNGGANSGQNISVADMAAFDGGSDEDVFYDVFTTAATCNGVVSFTGLCNDFSGSSSQEKLQIITGNTFTPADSFYTHDMVIAGTLTGNGHTYSISGSWSDTGTFNPGSGTVAFIATGTGETITATGSSFYNLTFNGSGGGWTFQDAQTISNILTLSAGTLSGGTATTITMSASGTPIVSNGGSFTPQTSTVVYAGTAATNAAQLTYYNLSFTPASGTPTYSFVPNTSRTWAVSNDTSELYIKGTYFEPTSGVLYAGTASSGLILRCAVSTACDASNDWTTSYDTTETTFNGFVKDTTNSVLYGLGDSSATIYRCVLATACDASGDWTVSYDTPESTVYSSIFDATNGILYVGTGSNGLIYRCAVSTACDASGDWTTMDTTYSYISSFAIDTVNGVIYAGTSGGSTSLIKCTISTACDDVSEWVLAYDFTTTPIYSLSIDTTNSVMYLGDGVNGVVYRCILSTGCDAGGEFTTSYDSTTSTYITDLRFNSGTGELFAAGDAGNLYSCFVSSACDAQGDWAITNDTTQTTIEGVAVDTTNNVVYTGSTSNGIIYRGPLSPASVTVQNNVLISANATLSAPGTLTIGGNFTNSGTFTHNSGTVVFNDNTKTSTLAGATTFYDFTVATAGKDLLFTAGQTFTFNGLLTVTGTSGVGNDVTFNSTTGSSSWTINHQGTESVNYLTVTWSACHGSSTQISTTNSVNGGNNGACWLGLTGGGGGVTISGILYLTNGSSPDPTVRSLKLSVNGGTAQTTSSTITTGVFSFTTQSTPTAGDIITIWINGETPKGTLVLRYGTSCTGTPNCTGLSLTTGQVILDQKFTSGFTNASLGACDNNAGTGCNTTDLGFDYDSGFANLVLTSGRGLTITSGTTFLPEGEVTVPNAFTNAGTVTFPNFTGLFVGGNFANTGTFNTGNTSTVEFNDASQTTVVSGSTSFDSIYVGTPNKKVQFTAGTTTTITRNFIIQGAVGSPVILESTSNSSWTINYGGVLDNLDYVTIRWGACHGSSSNIPLNETANNGGNNGACWIFPVRVIGGGGGGSSGGGGGSGGSGGGGGGAGGSPTQAEATVTGFGGGSSISEVTMQKNGSGYVSIPLVCVTDVFGTGAILVAVLTSGTVSNITISNGGSGYVSPIIIIAAPGVSGGSCNTGQGGGGGGGGGGGSP